MYKYNVTCVTCTLTNSLHIRCNMSKRIKRKRTLHWLLMKLVCIFDHLLLSCCSTITNSFIPQATGNSADHYLRAPLISIWLQDKTLCGFCHLLRGGVRGEELGPARARALRRDVPVRATAPQDPLPRGEHEAKHATETRHGCHSVQNLHWCSYQ